MKITLQNLIDKGYIEDITTERQKKNNTSKYIECKAFRTYPNDRISFGIYRTNSGKVVHYRDFTSSHPVTIRDEERFKHILYRIIASNYFVVFNDYKYNDGSHVINIVTKMVTNSLKEKIDNLTEKDIEERDQFISKLISLNKLYNNGQKSGWHIPYEVWSNLEKPDWLEIVKSGSN